MDDTRPPLAVRAGVPLALAALTVAAFAPALSGDFLNFDDDELIVGNPRFRGFGPAELRWMFTTLWMGPYQPLGWLSLSLDHALWGLAAPGYHLTSVLLHALGAIALYLLARRLFEIVRPGGADGWQATVAPAALAALLFAVHPLRAESVAWVSERRDVISGPLFVLGLRAWLGWAAPRGARPVPPRALGRSLAALAVAAAGTSLAAAHASIDLSVPGALRPTAAAAWALPAALGLLALAALASPLAVDPRPGARRLAAYLAALGCLLLSLLAKALGMAAPVLLLLLDRWPLARWRTRADVPALVVEKVPVGVLAAALAVVAAFGAAEHMTTSAQHTLGERVVQAAFGLAYYPARTLVPLGLVPLYELPASLSLAEPRFALAALAVVGVTVVLVLARRRFPAGLAAWIAYGITVAPVLGLVQAGPQLVADRYSYLSCLPFALLAAGLWQAWRTRTAAGRRLAIPLAALVVALLVVLTWQQAAVWRTSASLWEHAARLRPESPMVLLNLAAVRAAEAAALTDPAERRPRLEALRRLYAHRPGRDQDPRFLANLALVEVSFAEADPTRRARRLARASRLARVAFARARANGRFVDEVREIRAFVAAQAPPR